MKIAVLGGGNGAFAAAGDLTLNGHDIRLWRRNPDAVAAHRAAGGVILVKDFSGAREARPALITADIGEAVRGAELILCPTPATAQHDIAAALAPHLRDGQVIFLPPGSFGSVIFAKAARAVGNRAEIACAETGTLPWLTRKHGPFESAITVRAKRLPTGVFPLEHFDKWDIHKEGTQAAVRRVTDALDAERIALREALGYGAPHFPLADHYAKTGAEWMYGRGSHDRLTDSGDWREHIVLTEHRYMLEDTRIGLSFMLSVAALVGAAMPLTRAFLAIGGAICGEDFMQTGRTLASLGLGALDRGELQALLREGFR